LHELLPTLCLPKLLIGTFLCPSLKVNVSKQSEFLLKTEPASSLYIELALVLNKKASCNLAKFSKLSIGTKLTIMLFLAVATAKF
jgi:hypothetical protein